MTLDRPLPGYAPDHLTPCPSQMTNEPERSSKPSDDVETAGFDLYKVSKDYEKTAMHFND